MVTGFFWFENALYFFAKMLNINGLIHLCDFRTYKKMLDVQYFLQKKT